VLIVCTANVCRSPYAEYLFEQEFARHEELASVQVGSAGIRPVRYGALCELVAERHPHTEEWDEFVRRHRSIRATPSRVAQARLILTASRSNRAALAQVDPAARSRTFTLREAAWLGADYVKNPALEGGAAVTAFARYLDEQRGLKAPIRPIRTGLFMRPSDPLSIPDGHNLSMREHLRTLKDVERVSEVVARLIAVGSDPSATEAAAERQAASAGQVRRYSSNAAPAAPLT
jgi:protein-tyrosine phosphatase